MSLATPIAAVCCLSMQVPCQLLMRVQLVDIPGLDDNCPLAELSIKQV